MPSRYCYLEKFLIDHDYPCDSREALLNAYSTVVDTDEANKIFEQAVTLYESDLYFDYNGWLKTVTHAAEICRLDERAVKFIFVLCLSEHMKVLYERRGLSEELFDTAMLDFRSKLDECYDVHGVWGTACADWFGRFFALTRFALGRLQFEINAVPSDITANGRTLHTGDYAVSIHIPSVGPLRPDDCRESFIQANKFFAPAFSDGVVPFRCGSWLLSPEHRHMLKPDSNILKFMDFFTVTPHEKTVEGDLWRIFGRPDCSDISKLPRDNSLRRAYIAEIESGNMPHLGVGLFFMKNGNFL